MADMDAIIARLEREVTPFSAGSRRSIVDAVRAGNLTTDQADRLITEAQDVEAGRETPGSGGTTSGFGGTVNRKAESPSPPPQSTGVAKFDEALGVARSADVTFSDGRQATISGTIDEIRAKVQEIEDEITRGAQGAAEQGDPAAAQATAEREQESRDESVTGRINSFLSRIGEQGIANAELGTSLVTGMIAEPVSGIAGILAAAGSGGNMDFAAETVRNVSDVLTFQPKTKRGQETAEFVAAPFVKLEEGADAAASKLSMGNPYAATAIKTALLGAPEIVGFKVGRLRKGRVLKQLEDVERAADNAGINLDPLEIKSSVLDAAERMSPDELANNMPALRQALQDAAAQSKAGVTAAYDAAKGRRAFVDTSNTARFARDMTDQLIQEGWDLDAMPAVRARLGELAEIDTVSPATGARPRQVLDARIQDIELIRKRTNKARGVDPAQNAALNMVKKGLDDFIDTEFNNTAIRGDQAAVAAWKDARRANAIHKKTFSENKFVRDMILEDATPETMRRWMVGASAMAAKPQVASTIRHLKKILGPDSPQFDAIRMDLLHDVARPLFEGEKPNLGGFVKNYDKVIARNPGMVKELGLDMKDLKTLRDAAEAADKVQPGRGLGLDLSTVTARYFFGHKIARAAVRVTLARSVIDRMFRVGETGRRQLLGEMSGTDLNQPLIPRNSVAAGSVIANEAGASERRNDRNKADRGRIQR